MNSFVTDGASFFKNIWQNLILMFSTHADDTLHAFIDKCNDISNKTKTISIVKKGRMKTPNFQEYKLN